MINKKSGLVIVGAVILMMILVPAVSGPTRKIQKRVLGQYNVRNRWDRDKI